MEFEGTNRFFGEGVIVEVQHLNVGKDIKATTHDYLQCRYSVYWATVDEFTADRFLIEKMNEGFETGADAAFSMYRCEPPPLDAPESVISPETNAPYTTTDPVPECSHELVPHPEHSRACVRCGLVVDLCVYDEGRGFLRPVGEVEWEASGETVYAADQESVEFPVSIRPVAERGDPPDHTHVWKHPVDVFGEAKYRCRRCESQMIVTGSTIDIVHKPLTSWRPDTGQWQ